MQTSKAISLGDLIANSKMLFVSKVITYIYKIHFTPVFKYKMYGFFLDAAYFRMLMDLDHVPWLTDSYTARAP